LNEWPAGNDAAQINGVKTVVNDIELQSATPVAINPQPATVRRSSRSRSRHPRSASPAFLSGRTVTIPEGTTLAVRLIDALDSDRNKDGDNFRATLDSGRPSSSSA
jgi:hypothetical protein